MKRPLLHILLFSIILTGCKTTVPATVLDIYKPVRLYHPIVQGTNIKLTYQLKNVGTSPFVISDILPDCTSITMPYDIPHLIPPGDSTQLIFLFNSSRNVGLTKHNIRIYGNVRNDPDTLGVYRPGIITLKFSIPIIRPTMDGSDYEEAYLATVPDYEFLIDGNEEEQASLMFE